MLPREISSKLRQKILFEGTKMLSYGSRIGTPAAIAKACGLRAVPIRLLSTSAAKSTEGAARKVRAFGSYIFRCPGARRPLQELVKSGRRRLHGANWWFLCS